jgi:Glycosyl transferases group 1
MNGRWSGPARHAARSVLDARDMRSRRLPSLRIADRPSHTSTIYYLAPKPAKPAGGVRVIYRHVDVLNALGRRALVVHPKPGDRCEWFRNDTAVTGATNVTVGSNDVLVVPEYYGPNLNQLPIGPSVVIFNQRAYHTFDRVPYESTNQGFPYAAIPRLRSLLTVSDDNVRLLRHAFPSVAVHLARQVIDPTMFHPGHAAGRRIAFMVRRRAQERDTLLHILRSRGVLAGWDLVPIEGRSEVDTAEILRSCALFLSFSEREGFGLPPAEAMACGAFVVGYTGMAGRDFFDPAYCSPIGEGDLLAYAQAVEEAIGRYESDPASLGTQGIRASRAVLARYTVDNLRQDLSTFYTSLTATDA